MTIATNPTIKTNVSGLPESRVRVEAEIPPEAVQASIEQAARSLGNQMKMPGFRKGKIPPPVVIKRVGREAVFETALRESLGGWYVGALRAAGVEPVGDPKFDVGGLPEQDQPLSLSIEVGVCPPAKLGKYKGLSVGRGEAQASDEGIGRELERLQDQHARLEAAEAAAELGDFAVIDYLGSIDGEPFDGGEGRDQAIELGSGRLVEGFEQQLVGANAGDQRTVEITFPDDYPGEQLVGRQASFAVTVKEIKRKQLPELNDDFALEAAGFDTLDELKQDIKTRLIAAQEEAIEREFRETAVDAAAEKAAIDLPESLVKARAVEVWDQTAHSLSHRGISKEAYLQITGKSEAEIIVEAEPDAARDLKREAVLTAVVEKEQLEPDESEILASLAPTAEREEMAVEELLQQVTEVGRLDALKRDIAMRKAIDLIAEAAKPVPLKRAEASEQIWTPGQEQEQEQEDQESQEKLWTPGS